MNTEVDIRYITVTCKSDAILQIHTMITEEEKLFVECWILWSSPDNYFNQSSN